MSEYFTHRYSFAATGLKRSYSRVFSTRDAALDYMYKICGKKGLHVEEVYDDRHYKTYRCNNGVRFYINRAF